MTQPTLARPTARPDRTTTAGPTVPAAARLRRPTWRDPRLLVGVVVVALSVALGSWAVSSAGRTVPVYAADDVLVPGDTVGAADLRVVDVRLGAADDGYLHADQPLPDDAVVVRAVEPGELVRASSLGSSADLEVRSVAVPVTTGLSDRIKPGAQVDLWYVPADSAGPTDSAERADDDGEGEGGGAPGEPVALVSDVTVAQVDEGGGTLVVGGPVEVHTLVPVDDLPAVLTAVSGDGTIAVVPRGGA